MAFSNIILSSAAVLKQLLRLGLGVSELLASDLGFFGEMLDLDLEFQRVFGGKLESFVVGDFG